MTHELVGTMRFPQKTSHACGEHPVEAFLRDKTCAQEHDDIGTDRAETAESFFSVHKGHGEIEQDKIEMVWLFTEEVEAFETRLSGRNLKPRLGENSLRQNKSHRFIIHYEKTVLFSRRWLGRFSRPRKSR